MDLFVDWWREAGPQATLPTDVDLSMTTTSILRFQFDKQLQLSDTRDKSGYYRPDRTKLDDAIPIDICQALRALPRFCSQPSPFKGLIFYGISRDEPRELVILVDWAAVIFAHHVDFDYHQPFTVAELSDNLSKIPHLLGTPNVLNVSYDMHRHYEDNLSEFIICKFPQHVSTDTDAQLGSAFDKIQQFFNRYTQSLGHEDPPDISHDNRYWAVGSDEPTIVFLIWWYNQESERRFKDPSLPIYVNNRNVPYGDDDAWETEFRSQLTAMEALGMQTSSFCVQLRAWSIQ